MKDGRTHLAHKAEHAIDLESGAMVALTLQGADLGDTTSLIETAIAAAEQVEAANAWEKRLHVWMPRFMQVPLNASGM